MMNRFLTILLGLATAGVGCLLGAVTILSALGFVDKQLPLVPLVLTMAMSALMLCMGLITLMSYAYESSFNHSGMEMQFVFKKERVPWEFVQGYRKVFFRNTLSGKAANVWVMLKYNIPSGNGTCSRRAILLVAGEGSAVGMSVSDFKTPLDSFLNMRRAQ